MTSMASSSKEPSSYCAQRYDMWGGFAAAVASADDFLTARQADPNLQALFDKLDRLDSQLVGVDSVIPALSDAQFSVEEVSRLNSPLLDGLWKLATGQDCDGHTPFEAHTAPSAAKALLRLVCPRAYVSTAELLLSRHASDQVHNGEALLRAAGAGSLDMLSVLARQGCRQNGHSRLH